MTVRAGAKSLAVKFLKRVFGEPSKACMNMEVLLLGFIEGETCGHTLGLWNVMSPLCNSYWFTSIIHSPLHLDSNHANLTFSQKTPSWFDWHSSLIVSAQKTSPPGQKAPEQITTSLQRATSKQLAHHGRWWKGEGTCQDTQIEEEFEAQNQAASASLCQGSDFGSLQLQKESPTKLVGLKGNVFCVVCVRFWSVFVMFFGGQLCWQRNCVFVCASLKAYFDMEKRSRFLWHRWFSMWP